MAGHTMNARHGAGAGHAAGAGHVAGAGQYLAKLHCRGNRRWREKNLFDRLIAAALGAKPITRRPLGAGDR